MQNQINHFSQSRNKGNTMINTQKTKQENRVLRSIGDLFVDKSGGIDRAKNEKTVFLNNRVQYIEQIAFLNGRFVGEKGNLTTRGGEIVEKAGGGVVARNVGPRSQDGRFNDAGMWEITIPSNYSVIGERAFFGCNSLCRVSIPRPVATIAKEAFAYCCALKGVYISKSVTSLGEQAFFNCASLQEIEIPESITEIKDYTFYNCGALRRVILPKSLIDIGEYAFCGCGNLRELVVPGRMPHCGWRAFHGCPGVRVLAA